ncbi:MAG TPA: DedA family protein [Candidatus Baltobacteraceae bacterium]
MQHFTTFALQLVDHVGYLGLFIALMLGNVGAPVGAEVLVPAAGALVATGHLPSLWLTVAIAVAGELAGQSISYAIGYYGGRPFVARFGKYVRFHESELERVEGFFARFGSFAIFICRFVPVIRGIVGIPAGIAEMSLPAFYLWSFLGSLVFCGGLVLLGNSLGNHIDQLTPLLHRFGLIVLAVVVLAVIVGAIVAQRRSKAVVQPHNPS